MSIVIDGVLVAQTKHFDLNKPAYKIVFDNGKPSEHNAYDEEDLKEALKDFYVQNKNESYFDSKVFNSEGEDISESQFITELIGQILEEVGECSDE